MSLRNPFTPTFGRIPAFMTGRLDVIDEMSQAFEDGPGSPNLSTIFTGARGTGKTALLLYLSQMAQSRGWISVNVSAVPGMLDDIIERTRDAAEHLIASEPSGRLRGLSVGSFFGVEWDNSPMVEGNWRTKMTRMLEVLNEQGVGLVITVDEVTPDLDEMIHLATVYQHFVGEERRVALLLAGLPGRVSSLLRDQSVSFLRRANRYNLGAISENEIADGIRATVEEGGRTIGPDALDVAARASKGFPYLMQLVGFQSWGRNPGSAEISLEDAEKGSELAMRNFNERVLDATYYDMSPNDLRFLQAMLLDEGESRLADIAARLGETSSYASNYKRRLVERGVIGERGSAYLAFELPGFRDYIEAKLG